MSVDLGPVATAFGLTPHDLTARKRTNQLVAIRAAIAHVLTERGWKASEIADIINRDRTTVLHLLGRLSTIGRSYTPTDGWEETLENVRTHLSLTN